MQLLILWYINKIKIIREIEEQQVMQYVSLLYKSYVAICVTKMLKKNLVINAWQHCNKYTAYSNSRIEQSVKTRVLYKIVSSFV